MLRSLALAAVLALSACSRTEGPPLQAVQGFDAERYLGHWHEVARITAWFQKDCASDTTATYSMDGDEPAWIAVMNRCRASDGAERSAEGRARFTGPADQAALEVTFAHPLGVWLWPAAGAYIVVALDPDYRWSLVAHPSRNFAWILAREPELAADTIRHLRGILQANGYDACRLEITMATDRGRRLCDL